MSDTIKLSNREKVALVFLRENASVLVSSIPESASNDVFGDAIPSWREFKSLIKKGLCFQTEEDPIDLPSLENPGETFEFTFTESLELTELGQTVAATVEL